MPKVTIRQSVSPRSRVFVLIAASAITVGGAVMGTAAGAAVQPHRVEASPVVAQPHPGTALPAATSTPEATTAPATVAHPAPAPAVVPAALARPVYADNLDGWIREALDIMKAHNIPGSYEAIYRNVMRESTGNPQAINLYDSNAAAGNPSKGLLQVIETTFAAYHVPGTSNDVYDPVANIVAACNYAAQTYGSMDNVNSAY